MTDTSVYDHPVSRIELIETHISWVFLTGQFVYKIKKPVDLGFLNFSSLQKRRHFCEEEVRINSRLAPAIYLGVFCIDTQRHCLTSELDNHCSEFAVKMQQFDQSQLLAHLLEQGLIQPHMITQIAETIADFHLHKAAVDSSGKFGKPQATLAPAQHNFELLRSLITDADRLKTIDHLDVVTQSLFQHLQARLEERWRQGFIRECHGDLHLGNMAWIDDQPLIFDALEFNPGLRWIDVQSEIAFLVMDLDDHEEFALANRFLNTYLQITGDYAGLYLQPYYRIYRAMVRAKVNAIRLQQDLSEQQKQACLDDVDKYISLAHSYSQAQRPLVVIMHGVSGSGKSWLAEKLAQSINAITIRSDVERKRCFADTDLYTREVTDSTYQRLEELTSDIVTAGYSVIVDATFLETERRQRFRQLAWQLNVAFYIVATFAEESTLLSRIHQRQTDTRNVSDADEAVLKNQLDQLQPWQDDERKHLIEVDTGKDINFDTLRTRLSNEKP